VRRLYGYPNAYEALAILHHLSLLVNLVKSDLRMPGSMDEVALTQTVRRSFRHYDPTHVAASPLPDWARTDRYFPKLYDLTLSLVT